MESHTIFRNVKYESYEEALKAYDGYVAVANFFEVNKIILQLTKIVTPHTRKTNRRPADCKE